MLQNITKGALQCELGDWLPLMPVESSYSTSKDKSLSVALAFVNCDKLDVVRIMRPVKFLQPGMDQANRKGTCTPERRQRLSSLFILISAECLEEFQGVQGGTWHVSWVILTLQNISWWPLNVGTMTTESGPTLRTGGRTS